MSLTRRQFTTLIAPAAVLAGTTATLWPSQIRAQDVKLASGQVYEFKVSREPEHQIVLIGDLRFILLDEMAYARRVGIPMEQGTVFRLTDNPRAFRLDDAQIAELEKGPIVLAASHYYCHSGPDGNNYGCVG